MTSSHSQDTGGVRKPFIVVHRCRSHKFDSLAVLSLDATDGGSGTRLLGPKSCCAGHVEFKRWSVTPEKLREIAAELIAVADSLEPVAEEPK